MRLADVERARLQCSVFTLCTSTTYKYYVVAGVLAQPADSVAFWCDLVAGFSGDAETVARDMGPRYFVGGAS